MKHSNDSQGFRNQVIALAALMQSLKILDKLASTGYLEKEYFEVCIKSLFVTNPDSFDEVYGQPANLLMGLESLASTLKPNKDDGNSNLIQYVLGLMHLQNKLAGSSSMLTTISDKLAKADKQVEMFGLTHENVIANLAQTYSETLSTFKFRIQVLGNAQYLQQDRIANQVRVLLLCGIRATMLWRQSGGSRWSLFFKRKKIIQEAENLLSENKFLH